MRSFFPSFRSGSVLCVLASLALSIPCAASAFSVDTSPAPASHHAIAPADGESVSINPPSMVWREDATARSYIVELSADSSFTAPEQLIRVEGIALPFYNHNRTLSPGKWYWRYFVVRADGERSAPGPVRSFVVPQQTEHFPIPSMDEIFALMPEHPRIFVTPQTLASFQQKRDGDGREAWEALEVNAERALRDSARVLGRRVALAEAKIEHNEDSISPTWKAGEPVRRQVFLQNSDGSLFWLPRYAIRLLNAAAANLDTLSLAWQISGDERYLEKSRELIAALAPLRLDAHLPEPARADHDTVVYAYEYGLKAMALAYDRLYHQLDEAERAAALSHIEYHAQDAGQWLKKVQIHTAFQQSHPQQCMHALLVTVLATAKNSEKIDAWVRYLVPQYMNRIAWTSEDGGYFEGQTYGHKFAMILEGLAAVRSATGVDLFKKPEIRNSGEYWLYAMNLNYWFNHWGENYSLIWPHANPKDAYITAFLAAMNDDPYVKWYSQTVLTNPQVSPFDYISATPLRPRPPIDVPQAKAFPLTGTVSAYNKLYDHSSERIFFRSSRWGSQSHAHADQNGFVIHSGGEILAPDTGYYTYYGDNYHMKWSKSTFAHNSMLVNGEPQQPGNRYHGGLDGFFHGSRLTYFVGDASAAYDKPLETFRRAVLYVRPATYVIYDELAASAPSTYSWLLNVFQKPQIDRNARRITVTQQQMRMQVDTLLPHAVTYSASNERPYPIWDGTRAWSRFTEAFPQPWHIRVQNAKRADKDAFLTLIQTWNSEGGASAAASSNRVQKTIETASTVGAAYGNASEQATVLFRRNLSGKGVISGGGLVANAQAAAAIRAADGKWKNWLLTSGTSLKAGEETLFASDSAISASVDFATPAATALLHIDGASSGIRLRLEAKPERIFVRPRPGSGAPAAGELAFTWDAQSSSATFDLASASAATLWIDPVVNPLAAPAAGQLEVTDGSGSYTVSLDAAWGEDGNIVYFTEVMPREIGEYSVTASTATAGRGAAASAPADDGVSLFIQDRWDPYSASSRGRGSVSGVIRDGSGLFFTAAPGAQPHFSATLTKPLAAGAIDNILFNGDFEFGIPDYPPRGWTLSFARGESASWYRWTQAQAKSGKSSLHYVRDKNHYQLTAKPMRLLKAGDYHLRFYAKGNLGNARVVVTGSLYRSVTVNISPSKDWKLYETTVSLPAGYTRIALVTPGGPKKEELWLDGMEFGLVPNP